MTRRKLTMVVDISSILFRVAVMQKRSPFSQGAASDDIVGLCMHISLMSIMKWYTKFKPDFVVFAFEGGNNWRKQYTSDVKARQTYKGNRAYDPEMAHLYQLVDSFKLTMTKHSSICCLTVEGTEADDVIGTYVQLNAREGEEILILSGDRDFTQLLKEAGVKLIDPDTGKARNQPGDKNYEPDLDYWLFLKCVRGDGGDHVPSAFPRVRETRVRKAYDNQYERLNFMNETWTMTDEHGVDHTFRVGDLFEQNKVLLSLYDQPSEIREKLAREVTEQTKNLGTYSHFHFLRFLDEYKLVKVRQEAMRFVELLANNQRYLKGEQRAVEQVKKPVDASPELHEPRSTSLLEF